MVGEEAYKAVQEEERKTVFRGLASLGVSLPPNTTCKVASSQRGMSPMERFAEEVHKRDDGARLLDAKDLASARSESCINPTSPSRWEKLASDPRKVNYVLTKLKAFIGVICYLDRQTTHNINGRLTIVANSARHQ
ncbi:hypothetical protein CPLU01_16003 [Colletotrichum plurivorum]|uniref:Uncharacterized protein n=1 Tax=Colletotrichum plurivorum TaxID=2175906 RepID=A0A8H6J2Y2_9PEZI|nr:hypothetical protein CPLU01_16003 [Colletotrichum plurivorum]